MIDQKHFTETELQKRSLEIIRREQSKFVQIWFYTPETQADSILLSKRALDVSYGYWNMLYEEVRAKEFWIARAVAIGDSAVLQIQRPGRPVRRIVLMGHDPLKFRIRGVDVDLTCFAIGLAGAGSEERRLFVYAWVRGKPDEKIAIELSRILEMSLGPAGFVEKWLKLRGDPWFIDESFYPVFPPFERSVAPPPQSEYVQSIGFSCFWALGTQASCRESRFRE